MKYLKKCIPSRLNGGLRAAATAALVSLAGVAQAAPVTVYFTGTFSAVFGAQAAVLDGQAFSGSLSYDAARAPDSTGGNFSDYRLGAGAMAVSTALGSGSTAGVGTLRQAWGLLIGTALNGNFVGDNFGVSGFAEFDLGLSIFDRMGLTLVDSQSDADSPLGARLSALPTRFALSEFNAAEFRVGSLTSSAYGNVACLSTSSTACSAGTTAVPEPGTLALCFASLLGLAVARRR
ncbi:MAG: PEP-CTERM sorting domain-containing protein [Rubrivivax sp.]|nr:PEP-CTERM sorting domain-containing protein [Rubrivivax sp.]